LVVAGAVGGGIVVARSLVKKGRVQSLEISCVDFARCQEYGLGASRFWHFTSLTHLWLEQEYIAASSAAKHAFKHAAASIVPGYISHCALQLLSSSHLNTQVLLSMLSRYATIRCPPPVFAPEEHCLRS